MFVIRPGNQAQKYLLMRRVAHEVTKHGADAVIRLGEVWTAPADSLKPYQHAADSPVREEALVATLVMKRGDPVDFTAAIHREADGLDLGETEVLRSPGLFSFAPVYEAWGRPIPKEWVEMMKQLHETSGAARR
jgi:hypothetical protein